MTAGHRRLRVLVVAPERHALRQPHAGGLEAVVWDRVRRLRRRGHDVTLCAADGSDFLGDRPELRLPSPQWMRAQDASDSTNPPGHRRAMTAAFDRVLESLLAPGRSVDVVDNHSLHGDPIRWSSTAGIPVVTTLHTPPLPEIVEAAGDVGDAPHRFVAVSQHTARAWSAAGVDAFVFPNGVDTARWRLGDGGGISGGRTREDWVWFGRIVPEKAPHLAIHAARLAGARIVLAGRIGDPTYFVREIAPLLGDDAHYAGPLHQPALSRLVGSSAVALVTPVWSEPFGLVLAEALATGTPVAAFDAGGVGEVLDGMPGAAVVAPGDVRALSNAATMLATQARGIGQRAAIRRAAVARYSLDRRDRDVERVLAHTAMGSPATVERAVVG
ncbi:glycosyltransferase [Microbacterium sp. ARD31]|uniref:glycosyltransferase n=1 Tax=Microbacterium sp. ARD31 TaxID=2962576 RepID=UPI002881F85F|nr:glycosyltransferase [Microbacterium sp. ARD31]MDT0182989.1 glycosyltransferase [Microbacterium sp. ARD31]